MATVYLKFVSKSFGAAEVLHDIDLKINDKEFVVFVGPSGCGKSTLLRIIAGLEEATTGSIIIDEMDVSTERPVDRGIAMVFQSYALYPHLTVFENIAFPLRVQKMRNDKLSERVEKAAEILQITDKLKLKPRQLSGGQRQRAAIGRSIVRDPKVFLFDEPLSNLDASLRGEMRVELSRLQKELQATMIYVTHDQTEAMTMADRIVVLNEGRVEQFGTPMKLYHHPATKFVAGFIGQPPMNFVPASVIGNTGELAVELPGGCKLDIPVDTGHVKLGDSVEVGIRPEDFRFGKNGLSIFVDVLERLGGASIAYGKIENGNRICASLPGNAAIAEGDVVDLEVDPQDCHVFDEDGRGLQRNPKLEFVE